MTGWLNLADDQRRTSIAQVAINSGITAKAIKKDWWVTLTLKALFESNCAKFFIFKGGTSLSKGISKNSFFYLTSPLIPLPRKIRGLRQKRGKGKFLEMP